jgi:hypothetical protein
VKKVELETDSALTLVRKNGKPTNGEFNDESDGDQRGSKLSFTGQPSQYAISLFIKGEVGETHRIKRVINVSVDVQPVRLLCKPQATKLVIRQSAASTVESYLQGRLQSRPGIGQEQVRARPTQV